MRDAQQRKNGPNHYGRIKKIGSIFGVLFGLGLIGYLSFVPKAALSQAAAPAIQTDRTGYPAGSTITVTGTGFGSGEVVSLLVSHADGTREAGMGHEPFSTAADANGQFAATWSISQNPWDTGSNDFVVQASGAHSGAAAPAAFSRVATLQTDKYDYQPGETALITGAGFQPIEAVTIHVEHANGLEDGQGHVPFSVVADTHGSINATWQVDPDDSEGSIFRMTATGATSGLAQTSTFTDLLITIIDDGGPDDEVGQKDLNFMQVDNFSLPTSLAVNWGWDDTAWSGGNTGDACALFDTNGDGKANYVMCVGVGEHPASQQYVNKWICSDNSSDQCTAPNTGPITTGLASTFTSAVVPNSDPFRLNSIHIAANCVSASGTSCVNDDTVATGTIVLSDFGGATTARLINVCSYPSAAPTSNARECVVTPNAGFLTIVKDAPTGTTQQFTFNASAGSAGTPSVSSWTITGSGSVQNISYAATTTLDLNEVVPMGWRLDSAACVIQSAVPTTTGTGSATGVNDLEIKSGLETVCTFTNGLALQPPGISGGVTKTANPTSIPETGGSVTYTVSVANTGGDATLDSLTDDKFGIITSTGHNGITATTCAVPQTLAAGSGSYSCTFTATLPPADYPANHVNIVTASSSNAAGTSTGAATATVTYTDVLPDITVTKTGSPTSVPETGGNVTFTYVMTNNSTEAATISALSDDKFGTLAGDADCQVGTVLAGGASCSFTATFAIPAGDSPGTHVNVFTATGQDDDGNSDSGSDSETVTYTDRAPAVTIAKSVDANADGIFNDSEAMLNAEDTATYKYAVTNTSPAAGFDPLTIDTLVDDRGTVALGDDKLLVSGGVVQSGVTLVKTGGDQDNLLESGETWTYTWTAVVPVSSGTPTNTNTATVTARDDEGTSATASDTASVRFVDYGQIAPTGTTCTQYVTGTGVDFSVFYASQGGVIQYQVKANKISSTNPGVFFNWTGVSKTITGPGSVFIDQSDNNANIGPFAPVPNDVKMWLVTGTNCTQVQLANSHIQTIDGDVTVTIATAAPAGSYYLISVKYDTGSVVGESATGNPTVKFSFTTQVGMSIVETDVAGITLAPKK